MRPVHLDLFSGIGGFSIAAGWSGFETRLFCEIDPFCQRVLRRHWPHVPLHDDIRTLTKEVTRGFGIERVDLVTGGFPCQPWSLAGQQKGTDDPRHLWPAMRRVIADLKPTWTVAENVRGILSMGHEQVCLDLEAEGYEVGTLVLPAVGVNAPHRRERVWIVGHLSDAERRAGDMAARYAVVGGRADDAEQARVGGCRADGRDAERALADAERERCDGQPYAAAWNVANGATSRWKESAGGLAERGQAARSDAAAESKAACAMGLSVDGIPAYLARPQLNYWDGDWERGIPRVVFEEKDRAKKLKALGNAIVPMVAYPILRSIREVDAAMKGG